MLTRVVRGENLEAEDAGARLDKLPLARLSGAFLGLRGVSPEELAPGVEYVPTLHSAASLRLAGEGDGADFARMLGHKAAVRDSHMRAARGQIPTGRARGADHANKRSTLATGSLEETESVSDERNYDALDTVVTHKTEAGVGEAVRVANVGHWGYPVGCDPLVIAGRELIAS